MTEVGVRALRDHLSRHLAQVQTGDEILVTDRGRAVARIVPVDGESVLERLMRDGLVTRGVGPSRFRPRPVKASGTVSDLVGSQRG